MTTIDEAFAAVGLLVAAIPGFREDEIDGLTRLLARHTDDGDALIFVCDELARTWTGRMRPSEREILDVYFVHPDVKRARDDRVAASLAAGADTKFCGGSGWIPEAGAQRPCPRCNPYLDDVWQDPAKWARYLTGTPLHLLHDRVSDKGKGETPMPTPCRLDTRYSTERVPSMAEGMQIAADEYFATYTRRMGVKPDASPELIVGLVTVAGRLDSHGHFMSSFPEMLDAFRGDQARLRASLRALGSRVVWSANGYHFGLKPDEGPPTEPPEPRSDPAAPWTPRDPSEASQDAADLMRDALASVGRRMDEA